MSKVNIFEGVKLPDGLSAKPFWLLFASLITWVVIVSMFRNKLGKAVGTLASVGAIIIIAIWGWYMFFK